MYGLHSWNALTVPFLMKRRIWFGTDQELDAYYANCTALTPEPEYSFPTTQYRLPALAAIYGYSWMSGTFDRSFLDRNRLWLEGDGTAKTAAIRERASDQCIEILGFERSQRDQDRPAQQRRDDGE